MIKPRKGYNASKLLVSLLLCFVLSGTGLINSARANDLPSLPTKEISGKRYFYYVVQPGEQIYDLADRWHLTRGDIVAFNLKVADGMPEGTVLYFPEDVFGGKFRVALTDDESPVDVSVDETPEAYVSEDTAAFADGDNPDEAERIVIPSLRLTPVDADVQFKPAQNDTELKVAVCLPFGLTGSTLSKQATYATDFYRGFLLAVDSLRADYANPRLKIVTIDTDPTTEKTFMTNANKELLADVDIIVAPDQTDRLNLLGRFGRMHQKYVFNVFQPRDSTYLDNPYMLQGTTPASVMYSKAHAAFIDMLGGATPVILENTQGKSDKMSFVTDLTKELERNGIGFVTVSYSGTLTLDQLKSKLPNDVRNFVFIPTSSAHSDFQKFASALTTLKTEKETETDRPGSVRLFGYPEYTRFSDSDMGRLRSLNTTIYSRFYNNPKALLTHKIQNSYNTRYGVSLPEGVPNQALYGFDVARWLIELASNGELTPNTIQGTWADKNSQLMYRFRPVDGGGFVNDAILLINLTGDYDAKIQIL